MKNAKQKSVEIYRLLGESVAIDGNLEIRVTGITSHGAYLEFTTGGATKVEAKPRQSLFSVLWKFFFRRRKR